MGLLSRGSTWLARQLSEKESVTVSITRGTSTTTGVRAVPCPSSSVIEISGESQIEYQGTDFLILAADYVFDDVASLPERGDKITRTIGGDDVVYDVLPLSNEGPSRYSDAFHLMLRVRTKQAAA